MTDAILVIILFLPLALFFLNIFLNLIDAQLQEPHRDIEPLSTSSINKRSAYMPSQKRSLLRTLEVAFDGRYRVYPSALLHDVINLGYRASSTAPEHSSPCCSLALDFILCDPKTLNVVCVVEAQPRSVYLHNQSACVSLAQVLEAASVPLVILPSLSEYQPDMIWRLVDQQLVHWASKTHRPDDSISYQLAS